MEAVPPGKNASRNARKRAKERERRRLQATGVEPYPASSGNDSGAPSRERAPRAGGAVRSGVAGSDSAVAGARGGAASRLCDAPCSPSATRRRAGGGRVGGRGGRVAAAKAACRPQQTAARRASRGAPTDPFAPLAHTADRLGGQWPRVRGHAPARPPPPRPGLAAAVREKLERSLSLTHGTFTFTMAVPAHPCGGRGGGRFPLLHFGPGNVGLSGCGVELGSEF